MMTPSSRTSTLRERCPFGSRIFAAQASLPGPAGLGRLLKISGLHPPHGAPSDGIADPVSDAHHYYFPGLHT